MGEVAQYTYISIFPQPLSDGRRTLDFTVRNNRSGELIGHISWYSPWRCYCLVPEPDTVWSRGCLADVEHFMQHRAKQWSADAVVQRALAAKGVGRG